MISRDDYLTSAQAAKLVALPLNAFRTLHAYGCGPRLARRAGRTNLFRRDEVLRWNTDRLALKAASEEMAE